MLSNGRVYRSPQQDDLFESMQEVIDEMSASVLPSGVTLKEIMNTWTDQAGFPLISVSRTSATEINLSQVNLN
jgi:aminopeptidase N